MSKHSKRPTLVGLSIWNDQPGPSLNTGPGLFVGSPEEAMSSRAAFTLGTPNGAYIKDIVVANGAGHGVELVDSGRQIDLVDPLLVSNRRHGVVVRPMKRNKHLFRP